MAAKRDELLAVVDRLTLAVPDRRAKESLLEVVAASKKATLAEILPGYVRDRLKELCRARPAIERDKSRPVELKNTHRVSGADKKWR